MTAHFLTKIITGVPIYYVAFGNKPYYWNIKYNVVWLRDIMLLILINITLWTSRMYQIHTVWGDAPSYTMVSVVQRSSSRFHTMVHYYFYLFAYLIYKGAKGGGRGARWSSGQCARRAIAEAKHRSQWWVIGWVTKIYYLELLRALEGTLSRWSRLRLQSLAPTPISSRVDARQAAGRKNNCRIFITTWWKHVVPTPISGIRVRGRYNGAKGYKEESN
jgi:hypothetical protein